MGTLYECTSPTVSEAVDSPHSSAAYCEAVFAARRRETELFFSRKIATASQYVAEE
jgi:hypothetical protein